MKENKIIKMNYAEFEKSIKNTIKKIQVNIN